MRLTYRLFAQNYANHAMNKTITMDAIWSLRLVLVLKNQQECQALSMIILLRFN